VPDYELIDRIWFDFKVTLRILVVTDDKIGFWDEGGSINPGFTMRGMLRAMWDAPKAHYPYTRFVMDHAVHGSGAALPSTARSVIDPITGATRKWTEYQNFRFDSATFDIRLYDQIWFFGYWPGNPGESVPPQRMALSAGEVNVVAKFMDRGGGVFATGDHWELGIQLAGDLPRVRRMRRWSYADGVPSGVSAQRIDTTIPQHTKNGHPSTEFADQSDDVPKPIRLKRFALWDGLLAVVSPNRFRIGRWAPHPVLCSPMGPIDILPDHMHEGIVNADSEVVLNGQYTVDGVAKNEFPSPNLATPKVIAWATARGGTIEYDTLNGQASSTVDHREVPTIGVYDGEPVKLGRIVVDGTWHNWIDINVLGTGAGTLPPRTGLLGAHLELVSTYYRNIAQWLATPSQRQDMHTGLFFHIVANTGGWAELVGDSALFGEMATDVLGQRSSACVRSNWVFDPWWVDIKWKLAFDPKLGMLLPDEDIVHRHVLGAMAQAAYERIPKLKQADRPDAFDDEDRPDTSEQLGDLAQVLSEARGAALVSLSADLRSSIANTQRFLDEIDRAAARSSKPARRRTSKSASPSRARRAKA
jgi:hypothetical protein